MTTSSPGITAARAPWVATNWVARLLAVGTFSVGRLSTARHLILNGRRWLRRRGAIHYTVTTRDGQALDCLRIASTAPQRRLPVVMTHGWGEVKEVHLPTAALLLRLGHDVILFDYRCHGRSTGAAISFGVEERHDVKAIIDHARAQGWIDSQLLTWGYSLGAGTMLQHAALDDRVAGVIALAPFADLRTAVDSFRTLYAPFLDRHWLLGGFEQTCARRGYRVDHASTLDAIERITAPVLIAVGTRDRHLASPLHASVLAAAKRHGPLRFLEIPDATHLSIRSRRWQPLHQATLEFSRAHGLG